MMHETEERVSPWRQVVPGDRSLLVREYRPRLTPVSGCRKYNRVYRPKQVEMEGACRNYNYLDRTCIFCVAGLMSNVFHEIPYDVRADLDRKMGW
jgi:hypothetical protein